MRSDVLDKPDDITASDDADDADDAEDAVERLEEAPPANPELYRQVLTAIVAFGPPLVLALVVMSSVVGRSVPWFAIGLAAIFLLVIGHGVTIGFHRLFTHRGFEACRPLKILLAVIGSMSFQGSLIGWVADHRRHHRYVDRVGDPHSPLWIGPSPVRGVRGFWHAHVGWTFRGEATSREKYAADLLADRDLVLVDKLFLPCCVLTLALPFGIGYLWAGDVAGGVAALLIAGVIRVGISHNFTWSINSVCHRFGTRSFPTRDASTNVRALAFITMGESWHNNHHAFPRLARHGIDPGQLDTSAACIRLFERLGWVKNVQWPDAAQIEARRAPA